MKKIAIYGAGGFGREVRGMLESHPEFSFAGYFDDFKEPQMKVIADQFDDVLIGIADPRIRARIVEVWAKKIIPFATLISPDVKPSPSVHLGRGCIICSGVKFTIDIQLGNFVIVNLNSTIGHDVVIGDFCSLMPSVNISGNVVLGKRVFVGTGATVLQGLSVGDDVIIGAGALVTHNIAAGQKVMGLPAK